MGKLNILIVDDEQTQREILAGYLKTKNHIVFDSSNVQNALEIYKNNNIDIIISDLKMPHQTGIDLLKTIKSLNSETAIILITAFGTIENAVEAMREGAYDFLTKPINFDELDLIINKAKERNLLISENKLLKEHLAEKYSFSEIISQSGKMKDVLSIVARSAQSNASILIRGESGTGKELIAKAIHFTSNRKNYPFIAVNCAALNDNLLESELFGHEKGAFTGADKQRRGRFELADGGTIFLDEIGDISISTQVKLLRVLQEHTFERVGGNESISVDIRIIAATNKNLEDAIRKNTFREDLFYRINVISIEIPPLRERREDIAPLIDYYLNRFSLQNKKKKISFSKEALDALLKYDYPGNVRELENIIQRSVIMSRGEYITTKDLPQILSLPQQESLINKNTKHLSLHEQVTLLEKDLIFEALRNNNNNQSKAAKLLGISERNLRYRLKKWGVK